MTPALHTLRTARGFFPSCGARRMAETAVAAARDGAEPMRRTILSILISIQYRAGPSVHRSLNRQPL